MTTRQLAGHLAGVRHYADKDEAIFKEAKHFSSITQALSLFQDDPLLYEPGTNYTYSSYGWNLVSAVVEGAAQEEFLRYLQRAVFEPLLALLRRQLVDLVVERFDRRALRG